MTKSIVHDDNELWLEIPNTDGQYMVSNKGRIKSVYVYRACHGNIIKIVRERIMKPFDNGNGYLVFGMRQDGRRQNFYVHRLVANAFLEKLDGKDYINHKDYDRSNNSCDNLEWCTQKENVMYSAERMSISAKKRWRRRNEKGQYCSK